MSYPGPIFETSGPTRRRKGLATVAAVALVSALVGGGAGGAVTYLLTQDQPAITGTSLDDTPSGSQNASRAPAGSVQQVADRVLPSVVSISIMTPQGSGGGSGIIISENGLILTNNHVVEMAERGAELTVTFNDGKTAEADVVGLDPVTDLAVIRAQGVRGLTPAKLGDSTALVVGQDVVAIGSPLGLSGTVTTGIVSALHRPVRTDNSSNTVIDAIQTDAAINPGNSGGALVDMAGRVVGINTAIATVGGPMGGEAGSIGVGFAIPINQARPIARQLITNGRAEHAQLSVTVSTATSRDGTTEGAAIQSVQPGGAAARAGLRPGDVVTKVDDRRIPDADALIAAVRSYRPGDKVRLTYERNGRTETTTAMLGSDEGEPQRPQEQAPSEGGDLWPFPFR